MRILISGCLLGLACRYDGEYSPLPAKTLQGLKERFTLIPVCPEQLGGLPTPRPPAERVGDQVISRLGADVTAQYHKGATETLKIAKTLGCRLALLKEKSPSCGCGEIYDGNFQQKLIAGDGVTAELFKANGIAVFGESRIPELLEFSNKAEG